MYILYYYIKFLKREWLSNVVPIKLAIIALMISPGTNVNDNKNALLIGICIMNPIMIVPTISNNKTPNTSIPINNVKEINMIFKTISY